MNASREILDTSAGEFRLMEYRLRAAGREWSVLHAGAVLSEEDEARVIHEEGDRLPYGVRLWPSSIALAHEIAADAGGFRGETVLELGAGTGLPGIVASSLGAVVTQTDRDELSLQLCRRNGERNGLTGIVHRTADWTAWEDSGRYARIIGSDVLYGESLHPRLRAIFESNLATGGRILLADPFRAMSIRFLEAMQEDGWGVSMSRYDLGEDMARRSVGVFGLTPPGAG